MSGFAVVLFGDGEAAIRDGRDTLTRVAAPLASLGPHGAGAIVVGAAGLAHTLLATSDRSTIGPWVRRDDGGEFWLTGDIRLDGRDDTRRAVEAAGVALERTPTDEAIVLAAYRAWGQDAPSRLRGDFSFALFDVQRAEFLCARDGLGVRPLFYADTPRGFVCANTIRAVLADNAVDRTLDEAAIVSFLQWGYNCNVTTTTFRGVRRLEAGHQLTVHVGSNASTPTRHWRFPEPEPLRLSRDDEYVERFRDLLDQAVRDRARPAGTVLMLSGGLDSTALAATMRRTDPTMPVYAFTNVITALRPDDEGTLAALVARPLGLHHEIVADLAMPLEHLGDPRFDADAYGGEPTDAPDIAAWRRLAPRIAAQSPVLFVGEDGDALLRPPSIRTMLRHWPALDVLGRTVHYTVSHRHHPHLGLWWRQRLARLGRADTETVPSWLRADLLARTGPQDDAPLALHPSRPETHAALCGSVWQQLHESSDAIHAGAPLESRWPLLDTRLLEFVLAIPPIPWCQRKELIRRAFRTELPSAIVDRPKTPLPDYFERQVVRWRTRAAPSAGPALRHVADFVDTSSVESILRGGATVQVLSAWRVLQLDRWLSVR